MSSELSSLLDNDDTEIYRMIIQNSTSGIYVFSQEKKYVFVNKAMEYLTGYSKKELLSLNYLELVHPDYREKVEEMTNQALTGNLEGMPLRPQFVVIRKDGKKIWAELIPTLIKYRGEIAILGNVIDITEHKRMEKRVESLGILYRELGKAVNSSRSLSELGKKILGAIRGRIDYDMADILTYSYDKNTLTLCVEVGYPDELKENTVREQKVEKKSAK